jgi:Domain of unknown function (DUF4091)
MSAAPSVSTVQAAVAKQQPGLYLNDYSADPESSCASSNYYNAVISWAVNLHPAGVNQLVSQQPVSQLFNDGAGRTAADNWTMLPVDYNGAVPANISYVMSQPGNELWSHDDLIEDNYSPKWELDFPTIQYHIQPGFISQSLGLKGLNYWSIDNWSSSPWINPNGSQGSHYPGEGQLVYPGANAGLQGVAPSMRIKYLRDGGLRIRTVAQELRTVIFCSIGCQFSGSELELGQLDDRSKCAGIGSRTVGKPNLLQQLCPLRKIAQKSNNIAEPGK